MEFWITLSILAAFFQSVRFMLQKKLSQVKLTASGATFARFVYSAPIAVCLILLYLSQADHVPAVPGGRFWVFGVLGGAAQITATVCTVMLFGRRNFAVGMTFTKTEVLLTVLIGGVILGELVSLAGFVAIILGVIGVLVLSGPIETAGPWWKRILSPSAALGVLAGALFGVSGVSYRAASLVVESGDPIMRAGITLAAVTSMQLVGMALWLLWRDRAEIGNVLGAWRTAGFIGITSLAGSFCWFAAFTLQNAAYVKAVGQVELIFGLLATVLIFKESISRREALGISCIGASVLALILWA